MREICKGKCHNVSQVKKKQEAKQLAQVEQTFSEVPTLIDHFLFQVLALPLLV